MRNKVATEPAANSSLKKPRIDSKTAYLKSQEQKGTDRVMRIIVERFYLATFWGRTFERVVGALA